MRRGSGTGQGRESGPPRRRTGGLEPRAAARQAQCGAHAPDHGLAVAQHAQARRGLECMAERVAEVEELSRGPWSHARRCRRSCASTRRSARLPPSVQRDRPPSARPSCPRSEPRSPARRRGPYFNASPKPDTRSRGGRLFSTSGSQTTARGRMEAAGQVLAVREVDAGLAAEPAVELAEQGRGHAHPRDAALIDRGGEPRRVGHRPAAERHDGGVAPQARGEHRGQQVRHRIPGLGRFARRKKVAMDLEARALQGLSRRRGRSAARRPPPTRAPRAPTEPGRASRSARAGARPGSTTSSSTLMVSSWRSVAPRLWGELTVVETLQSAPAYASRRSFRSFPTRALSVPPARSGRDARFGPRRRTSSGAGARQRHEIAFLHDRAMARIEQGASAQGHDDARTLCGAHQRLALEQAETPPRRAARTRRRRSSPPRARCTDRDR